MKNAIFTVIRHRCRDLLSLARETGLNSFEIFLLKSTSDCMSERDGNIQKVREIES